MPSWQIRSAALDALMPAGANAQGQFLPLADRHGHILMTPPPGSLCRPKRGTRSRPPSRLADNLPTLPSGVIQTITEDCLQCVINMNLELENKTALVTGSTAGIGLAIAASLAREGATVIINGRTKKRVNGAIKQIMAQQSNAKLEPLDADVSASTDVAATIKRFSKLDILINNVGIGERMVPLSGSMEAWYVQFFSSWHAQVKPTHPTII